MTDSVAGEPNPPLPSDAQSHAEEGPERVRCVCSFFDVTDRVVVAGDLEQASPLAEELQRRIVAAGTHDAAQHDALLRAEAFLMETCAPEPDDDG